MESRRGTRFRSHVAAEFSGKHEGVGGEGCCVPRALSLGSQFNGAETPLSCRPCFSHGSNHELRQFCRILRRSTMLSSPQISKCVPYITQWNRRPSLFEVTSKRAFAYLDRG